jgi:hypothetical protein
MLVIFNLSSHDHFPQHPPHQLLISEQFTQQRISNISQNGIRQLLFDNASKTIGVRVAPAGNAGDFGGVEGEHVDDDAITHRAREGREDARKET